MSVLKSRHGILSNVDILEIKVDKVLLLPRVHSLMIEPAQVDDQQWRKLDNVCLLGHFARSLADVALEIVDILLLEKQLKALFDTGAVVVLRQGEGQHGEVAVGDRLSIAQGTFDHGACLATEQLDNDGLIPLEVVDPVSLGCLDITPVYNKELRHETGLGHSVDIIMEPLQHGAEELV